MVKIWYINYSLNFDENVYKSFWYSLVVVKWIGMTELDQIPESNSIEWNKPYGSSFIKKLLFSNILEFWRERRRYNQTLADFNFLLWWRFWVKFLCNTSKYLISSGIKVLFMIRWENFRRDLFKIKVTYGDSLVLIKLQFSR